MHPMSWRRLDWTKVLTGQCGWSPYYRNTDVAHVAHVVIALPSCLKIVHMQYAI